VHVVATLREAVGLILRHVGGHVAGHVAGTNPV
ncbi:MAG: hypothetical protein RLZZ621_1, partial [Gemmatimonadota bacterium]